MSQPTYSIFASEKLKDIAHLPLELEQAKKCSINDFRFNDETDEELIKEKEDNIQKILGRLQRSEGNKNQLLANSKYQQRYQDLKNYFKSKAEELRLPDGAIHYNDEELRIDIDYSPKEFDAFFHDFYSMGGKYPQIFELEFSFFVRETPQSYFNDTFMHPAYADNLDNELKHIISMELAVIETPSPKLSNEVTEQDIIDGCLNNNNGFVIGEVHEASSPKEFLIDNMAYLKSKGVTTIYLEHLLHERHQPMLDAYFASNDSSMPRELELYLKNLDHERTLKEKGTFYNLVVEAKKAGLKVIAIDTQATYGSNLMQGTSDLYNKKATKDRRISMNKLMKIRLDQYNDGKKYVAFVGSAHVYKNDDIPGITNYLGCPGIVVNEPSNEELSEQPLQRGYNHPSGIVFDISYNRKPNHNPKASVNVSGVPSNVEALKKDMQESIIRKKEEGSGSQLKNK